MDHLVQLARAAPRAVLAAPLLLVGLAVVLALLAVLIPVLFIRRRQPFDRLVVILALLLLVRSVRSPTTPAMLVEAIRRLLPEVPSGS